MDNLLILIKSETIICDFAKYYRNTILFGQKINQSEKY